MPYRECVGCGIQFFSTAPAPLCANCDAVLLDRLDRVQYGARKQAVSLRRIVEGMKSHKYFVHPKVLERLEYLEQEGT